MRREDAPMRRRGGGTRGRGAKCGLAQGAGLAGANSAHVVRAGGGTWCGECHVHCWRAPPAAADSTCVQSAQREVPPVISTMSTRINIPPLTRGLLGSLVLFTALNAAARYRSWQVDRTHPVGSREYYAPYLTIVPSESLKYPWVIATSTLIEQNVFGLLFTGTTLFYGGRYLERAWSSTEYLKFISLISVIPNVLAFLIYITLSKLSQNRGLVTTSISGGISIQSAFIVAFKQLVPEHTVSLARGAIRARVKHFPAIFLLANTISGILLGTDTAMVLAWLGFFTSWIYLRFFRISPALTTSSTGEGSLLVGDASDTFSFASFFPDVAQPVISTVTDAIYEVLVAINLCAPFTDEDVDTGNEQAAARGEGGLPSLLNPNSRSAGRGSGGSGGSATREEAERRRQLALRALDERLQAATVKQPTVNQSQSLGETAYEPDLDRRDPVSSTEVERELEPETKEANAN
ncbi:hypothetical protein FH972_023310 [Carpinus fangiana]|uniref:Uncharacterized protein n=1 Tax=Carpinus fangiana TaxID=176857 RepID=A0A5N6KUV3_9ROSI|nr:hypothetical protein FH972_023310 [Carpinus fangiana]